MDSTTHFSEDLQNPNNRTDESDSFLMDDNTISDICSLDGDSYLDDDSSCTTDTMNSMI